MICALTKSFILRAISVRIISRFCLNAGLLICTLSTLPYIFISPVYCATVGPITSAHPLIILCWSRGVSSPSFLSHKSKRLFSCTLLCLSTCIRISVSLLFVAVLCETAVLAMEQFVLLRGHAQYLVQMVTVCVGYERLSERISAYQSDYAFYPLCVKSVKDVVKQQYRFGSPRNIFHKVEL